MTLAKERTMDAARILLADDEVTFLAATADLLRREGYHCDEVGDAASALARVSEGHYDLLITDLEMPGNADLQLVRDVGERSGGCPSSSSPDIPRSARPSPPSSSRWRPTSPSR
jgi:CheY-like chemotaxis protein